MLSTSIAKGSAVGGPLIDMSDDKDKRDTVSYVCSFGNFG